MYYNHHLKLFPKVACKEIKSKNLHFSRSSQKLLEKTEAGILYMVQQEQKIFSYSFAILYTYSHLTQRTMACGRDKRISIIPLIPDDANAQFFVGDGQR